jgi:hypothetical protein
LLAWESLYLRGWCLSPWAFALGKQNQQREQQHAVPASQFNSFVRIATTRAACSSQLEHFCI